MRYQKKYRCPIHGELETSIFCPQGLVIIHPYTGEVHRFCYACFIDLLAKHCQVIEEVPDAESV